MADYGIRRYRLRNTILSRGLWEGFTLEHGTLETDGQLPCPSVSSVPCSSVNPSQRPRLKIVFRSRYRRIP